MSKSTEYSLVPQLRFREFKSLGDWEEKYVEDFFDVGSSKRVLEENWISEGIPFYRTRELVSLSKNERLRSEIFISEELFLELSNKYGVPTEGDFLVSGVGTLGISYLVKTDDKFYFKDGNVLWFKKKRPINSNYFKYCFESDHIQNQIVAQASISTVGTYTIQNAKRTKLWYPANDYEQQKIADCLSSLDETITAESEKLEALKVHKKGLMQQLFPAEGESVPKLRFAEFKRLGGWKEKRLGDVGEIITGNTPSTKESVYYGGDYLFVSPADMSNERYVVKTKTTLSDIGYEQTRHVKANSVLFVCIGSTIGKVAQNKFECATNQQINSLVPYDNYSSDFLYSALELNAATIANIAGIQAVPIINKSVFSAVVVQIPTPKEQEKIAECFSSLDELITTIDEKIEMLKLHKKGLMQQLFPSTNPL